MTILPAIAAVGGLVGGGISAYGQMKQGQAEQEAANYNAQIAEQNATTIKENAVLNEYRQRKQLSQDVGMINARYAKSGVNLTGSPLTVLADSISNAELSINIDKYNSEVEARNASSQARMLRYQGEQARKLSYYKAGSTLLTSATSSVLALSKEKIGGATKIGETGDTGETKFSKSYSGLSLKPKGYYF